MRRDGVHPWVFVNTPLICMTIILPLRCLLTIYIFGLYPAYLFAYSSPDLETQQILVPNYTYKLYFIVKNQIFFNMFLMFGFCKRKICFSISTRWFRINIGDYRLIAYSSNVDKSTVIVNIQSTNTLNVRNCTNNPAYLLNVYRPTDLDVNSRLSSLQSFTYIRNMFTYYFIIHVDIISKLKSNK